MILNRVVSQLCPDAPLATHFATGVKNLIPMIFCHGNKVNAEEHFGVPMIMASHGYCVFSPTFMDKTACHATDKDGNDIPWEDCPIPPTTASGEMNQEFWDYFKDNCFKKRVAEINKMGEELHQEGFSHKVLGFPSQTVFDTSKCFIGGQSFGGWTAVMASLGDQPYFKACLAHDPAHAPHRLDVLNDKIDVKIPTHIVQSSGFFGAMAPMAFNYKTGFEEYDVLVKNLAVRIPDARLEALVLADSSHTD